MKLTEMKSKIIEKVNDGKENKVFREILLDYDPNMSKKHELIFFIKPELTSRDVDVDLNKVLDIIDEVFTKFDVGVNGILILGNEYLKKYDIMAQHYGVINRLAREGKDALSEDAIKRFKEIYGQSVEEAEILGGFQFLKRFPFFNPRSLNVLWENLTLNKLASGTYSAKMKMGKEILYLINGFHPYQLEHFIGEGRTIVVMVVTSDTDWSVLRRDMIGATNPEKANPGSIRRILLERKDELHIDEVSQGYNGVHLSAGPIEGLAEMVRFLSDYEKNERLSPENTRMGKLILESGISKDELKWLLSNPIVEYEGKKISVFDLTEEVNLEDAIQKLKQVQEHYS